MHVILRALGVWLLLQSLFLFSAAAGRAHALQEDDPITARAKLHLEAGVAYFNDGLYADAEREMSRAYELRPVPELQYNLAQCQERLGALGRAAASYRAYLKGRPDAPDASEVEQRIAEVDRRIAEAEAQRKAAEAKATSEPAPSAPAPPSRPPPPPEKVIFKEIIVYKEAPPKPGRGARYVGFGLLGLAAVGLAVGITFNVAAVQLNQSIDTQGQIYQAQFNLPIQSCPDMNQTEQAVLNKANMDASAVAGMDMMLQQQISRQLIDTYRTVAKNTCEFYRIASDNGRLNITGAAVGYAVAGLATVGAVSLFLYGRHLDQKQEKESAKQRFVPNLSMFLQPYSSPTGSGVVLAGRF